MGCTIKILRCVLVPRCKGKVVIFIGVVDGGLDVDDDGVVTDNFGGNVEGHDREHGVSEHDKHEKATKREANDKERRYSRDK